MIKKSPTKRGTGMFAKAMLHDAITFLPKMPDTEDINAIRSYLYDNLHYNSEQTRKRFGNYIISRMFPRGYADPELRIFAKSFPNSQTLRDVCFYRFLIAEPLEIQFIEEILFKNLAKGSIQKSAVPEFLRDKFPESKSIKYCARAIVEALVDAQVVKINKDLITYTLRDISLPAFAFVLHSEFLEARIYGIEELEQNRLIRTLLWNPDHLLPALYELRNHGIISKVSEIDNVRQFTLKYTLDKVVENFFAGEETS